MGTTDSLLYVIAAFVGFFLGIFIARWAFNIDKILRHLRTQTMEMKINRRLIQHLAKRQGLTDDELNMIFERSQKESA